MKTQSFKIFTLLLIFLAGITSSQALAGEKKKIIETSFEVQGICGMCETKIETAAMELNGVKMADWDKHTKQLKVVYNSKKISEEEIHQAMAAVGYDTPKAKATDTAYNELPGCCKYRDGQKTH